MAGIINDHETIRRFRNDLLDIVDSLREQLKRTEKAMEEVSAEWKDYQFQKYEEEFSKDKDMMESLCKDLEEFESDVLYPLEKLLSCVSFCEN